MLTNFNTNRYTTAIRNAGIDLRVQKKIGEKKPIQIVKGFLPYFNAGIIVEKSLLIINERIGQLPLITINQDTIINPSFFINVKIPKRIIDLLRDVRLSNVIIDSNNTDINFGETPDEFINGIKITNGSGGTHSINLHGSHTIYFPSETYRSNIPNVNKIRFTENSQPNDYIIILWYNAPLINLSPGYRVISNNTNLEYNSLQ